MASLQRPESPMTANLIEPALLTSGGLSGATISGVATAAAGSAVHAGIAQADNSVTRSHGRSFNRPGMG
jgi:hypothetical protein